MRTLVAMRGAPGAGKSTFIKKQGWDPYTICPDKIRLMLESPVYDYTTGQMSISQKNDKDVWKLAFDILERRMQNGEFIVFDSTLSKSQEFAKFKKLLEKHRYRAYCIDFSSVPVEDCLKQNLGRLETDEPWKLVPENVIKNIYSRLATQEVPSYFTKIDWKDTKAIEDITAQYFLDAEKYQSIVFFGDIHGCMQPLEKWFTSHPFSEETLYVFLGDYLDRGIQNKEVLEWLIEHESCSNCIFFEGNHEKWLRGWAEGEYDEELKLGVKDKCRSSEFFFNTSKQIETIDKKKVRVFLRRLRTLALIKFDGKKIIASHSGFGAFPKQTKLAYIAARELVNAKFDNSESLDATFEKDSGEFDLQVHGHRNLLKEPLGAWQKSVNLCGEPEFGEDFRILEVAKGA